MKLKLRLILVFTGLSLISIILLGYSVFREAETRQEVAILQHTVEDFLSGLPSYSTGEQSLSRLQEAISHQNSGHFIYILTDKNGKILSTGLPFERFKYKLQDLPVTKLVKEDINGGYFNIDKTSFFWSAIKIPKTTYILISIYRSDINNSIYFLPTTSLLTNIFFLGLLFLTTSFGTIASLINKTTEQEAQKRNMELYDSLTNLPNRPLLLDRLKYTIQSSRRDGNTFAVCYLDLKQFKDIYIKLGQEQVNKLLCQVGTRLQEALRESDTIARLDSDEFALLLKNVDEYNIQHIAKKILRALEENFFISGHTLFVRGNLGIVFYPQHGENERSLLERAKNAMEVAKKTNSDYTIYDVKHDEYNVKQLTLVNDLRYAINNDEFSLYYQPKISIKNGTVVGIEALLRWNHFQHGFISPDEFIPVAEQTGLITPLTTWILKTALVDGEKLHQLGYTIDLAVNISACNLQGNQLEQQLLNILATRDIPSTNLELEITESAMMSNPPHAMEILSHIDALGIKLTIDDFGTGYSSLMYLKQLPVTKIKIDKSFVIQMTTDENDATIVRATIDLAHDLGLEVVAEGIETHASMAMLTQLGCDIGQGSYISKPVPFDELIIWLSEQNKNSQPHFYKNLM